MHGPPVVAEGGRGCVCLPSSVESDRGRKTTVTTKAALVGGLDASPPPVSEAVLNRLTGHFPLTVDLHTHAIAMVECHDNVLLEGLLELDQPADN